MNSLKYLDQEYRIAEENIKELIMFLLIYRHILLVMDMKVNKLLIPLIYRQ